MCTQHPSKYAIILKNGNAKKNAQKCACKKEPFVMCIHMEIVFSL
jgi:hypothetical protein